jgi:hypothetical protein
MSQDLLKCSFILIENINNSVIATTDDKSGLFPKNDLLWKCLDWVGIVGADACSIVQSVQAESIDDIVD